MAGRLLYEFMLVAQKRNGKAKWYGDNKQSNVIFIPKIIPSADQHPTKKPIALMKHFLRLHSEAGDVVLDPYLGSGVTAAACEELGRQWIGAEIDPHWAAKATERIAREREQMKLGLVTR